MHILPAALAMIFSCYAAAAGFKVKPPTRLGAPSIPALPPDALSSSPLPISLPEDANPVAKQSQEMRRLAENLKSEIKAAARGQDPRSSGQDIEKKLTGERSSGNGNVVDLAAWRGSQQSQPPPSDTRPRPQIAHPLGFFMDAYPRAKASAETMGLGKEQVILNWVIHDRVSDPNAKGWSIHFAFRDKNDKAQATHSYVVSYAQSPKATPATVGISDDLSLAMLLQRMENDANDELAGQRTLRFNKPFVAQYRVKDVLMKGVVPVPQNFATTFHTDIRLFRRGVETAPDAALERARKEGMGGDVVAVLLDLLRDPIDPVNGDLDFWYHFVTAGGEDDPGVYFVNARTGMARRIAPPTAARKNILSRLWARLRPAGRKGDKP